MVFLCNKYYLETIKNKKNTFFLSQLKKILKFVLINILSIIKIKLKKDKSTNITYKKS